MQTQGTESVPRPGDARPATRTSIVIALLFFAIAIAAPSFILISVKDSHDGFVLFGAGMVAVAICGIAAVIGIVLTIVGLARGAQGVLARIAGGLALGLPVLALLAFALAP